MATNVLLRGDAVIFMFDKKVKRVLCCRHLFRLKRPQFVNESIDADYIIIQLYTIDLSWVRSFLHFVGQNKPNFEQVSGSHGLHFI